MAGAADQFLQEHLVAAEGGLGLAPPGGDLFRQFGRPLDHAHAAAAAAPDRLEHERITDAFGQARGLGFVLRQGAGRRQHGHAGVFGEPVRRDLGAKRFHHLRRRADEGQAVLGAGARQRRVLGQEAVAGMDRVATGLARDPQHLVDVEIGLHRLAALADQIAFVGLEAVQGEAVLVRVDRDRADAHLGGGTEHADRDLAAVGDQQLANAVAVAVRGCGRIHVLRPPGELAGSSRQSPSPRGSKTGNRNALKA